MTLSEYFQTPETVLPQELIYGALRVAESPSVTHQEAVGHLFLALHSHVVGEGLGTVWLAPLDVILDVERALVIQPDLLVVLSGGSAVLMDKVHGAPDLVIEVLSPNPRIGTLTERIGWFEKYGVRECWLVYPATHVIEVLQFEDGDVRSRREYGVDDPIESGVLPRLKLSPLSILGYGGSATTG